jgi:D-proline reductase (dithiol) PrdB
VSLIARHLEAAGIATVIIGSAQDIVETAGVPRFVFVDYPLGNPVGRPGEVAEQRSTVEAALELLTTAVAPRMTRRMDHSWGSDEWRAVYMHVGDDNRAELAELGRQRQVKQAARRAKAKG